MVFNCLAARYGFRAAAFNDSGVSPYSRTVWKRTK